MADNSHIEWTDATWNPITGCSLVSEGCRHCYAATLAATRLKNHPSRKGLARLNAAGEAKFTSEVRFNEQWLGQPLRWKMPRRIFVCAHADLFHENVPDEWIDRIFAVMALAPRHTFQVLTKRPERMRDYIRGHRSSIPYLGRMPLERVHLEAAAHMDGDGGFMDTLKGHGNVYSLYLDAPWPLPNVWLGTSIEDQPTADTRIPYLLKTPAAIRFVSAEPLLGPVDFYKTSAAMPLDGHPWKNGPILQGIDWIIVGGESGRKARPMHPDWARQIRDQCAAAGTAFLFKQWGEWAPSTPELARGNPQSGWRCLAGHPHVPKAKELYAEAGAAFIEHLGKKRAGRLLDGIEHNAFPETSRTAPAAPQPESEAP